MKLLFLVALLYGLSGLYLLQAQTDLSFEHYSTRQGLSHNSVRCIYQDQEGFMWFGTEDGLNKYDGYTFKQFRADPQFPEQTLRFNYIYSLFEDSKKRFWAGTNGLHVFNKHTDAFTAYLVDSTRFTYLNIALSIQEDPQGMLWFSAGGGLNRFDPQTKKFTSYKSTHLTPNFGLVLDQNGLFWMGSGAGLYQFNPRTEKFTSVPLDNTTNPNPYISSLLLDNKGTLWIGTFGSGLFHLDTRSAFSRAQAYNPDQKVKKIIAENGIFQDRSGYIWLATREGLQKVDLVNDQIDTYQTDTANPSSLSSNNVTCVYQDRMGTLWVGTDNGINKVVSYSKPFHAYQIRNSTPATRLDENKIFAILEDQRGKGWIGTAGGLYQFNPHTRQSTFIELQAARSNTTTPTSKDTKKVEARVIREDHKGRIWIGTGEGLYSFNPVTTRFIHYPCRIAIERMAVDFTGKLWIPGIDSKSGKAVLAMFNPEESQFIYTEYAINDESGLKDGYMKGITAGQNGDLWVAAGIWGIGHRDHTTGKFTHYLPNPRVPVSAENDVWSVYEDKQRNIWAGTSQAGLFRMNPRTKKFTHFTTHNGLPSNQITNILEDGKGKLWIGTNNGLSCFDPIAGTFRNFDREDGLPDNLINLGSAYGKNKRLYFGTGNGFVFFNPDSIHTNTDLLPVYITGVNVMEKKRNLPQEVLELPYHENFISFEFTALDFHAADKINYAYRLKNAHQDWIQSGNRRYAAYTNLDPGEYTFQVKATNSDGIWNETGTSLQFRIHPPWWRTIWAYVVYTFIGLALLYGFRKYTVNRERLKNDLKLKQIETQQLHELETIRSRFFANISHEFRTPLTLILGPLEKLIGNASENQNRLLYQVMERNARRLLHLINQLLDLSKVESGNLQLETKHGNINVFLQTLVASFRSLAESRNIHFTIQISQENYIVHFDRDKLEKIVVNLLSNAFKFTPDGGTIALRANLKDNTPSDTKVRILEIEITDSGIGIAPDETDKIFDRFYQVDSSHTRAKEGTGIGLALTKELVELHKGTITVASEWGKGTTFMVRLPLLVQTETTGELSLPLSEQPEGSTYHFLDPHWQPDGQGDKQTVSDTKESGTEESPLLLIVEDNKDLAAYIASYFEQKFRIIMAFHGKQGLQKAVDQIPDLIISDVMMPEMDGIELCKRLKTDERTSHIPVILLTAKAGEKSKLEGLEFGADDYLTKPFSGTELQIRVHNLIEIRKQLRKKFSREVTLQPADIAITSADEKFLQRIMAILETNYTESDFSLENFEKEAGMSRTQFYRKLKALTDQAPGELLRNFRLQKAVLLLKGSHGNITEVAYSVGFNSLAYFTRCFKELYGKSPSQYISSQSHSDQISDR